MVLKVLINCNEYLWGEYIIKVRNCVYKLSVEWLYVIINVGFVISFFGILEYFF